MKYVQMLKHHHLKATPQRLAIVEHMDHQGHISIEDLYQAVKSKYDSISLATLYKNVHIMMDSDLIREVKIPGQKAKYEIGKSEHAHLMCTRCGELKDIEFDSKGLEATAKQCFYETEEIAIVISGICPNCK